MAISPPSDLVLDVAKAVNPHELKVASAKLQSIANDAKAMRAGADGVESGDAYGSYARGSAIRSGGTSIAARRTSMHSRTAVAASAFTPNQKFEVLMLQQFIEAMMPEDAEEVFGKGTAGSIWKSMMAEQIGNQIAGAGGVGVADMITSSLKERIG
ncbi:rod-binding protein [Breoghania sp.]|uniref:rod-binding protein n=1 Tax=Breoghania sp. TaxID=2065378 RepID=UPI00260993C2|nr:rod-binding protein [Breoghania sp.]MDJ0929497.1 rod-binding protein [Breoghania sp.]